MFENPYIIISILVISFLLTVIFYLLFKSLKKSSYDAENHIAILEDVRDSFERQIYNLNDRLIQNEERWRDVNHLLIDNKSLSVRNDTTRQIYYSEFLKANGLRENDLIVNERLVFVLTPLNSLFYNDFITVRSAVTNLAFECIRGDEKQFKGDIFPEMLKYIVQSKIIVANINGRNPNVLYELGIAQALDKNVILISKEPHNIPIDVKSQRFLIYSDSDDLYKKLQIEIENLR